VARNGQTDQQGRRTENADQERTGGDTEAKRALCAVDQGGVFECAQQDAERVEAATAQVEHGGAEQRPQRCRND
jgi:hypothetical protein